MSITSLQTENFLINYSFVSIFMTVIFYWAHLMFDSKLNFQKFGQFSNYITNLLILILLILRWWKSHHIPISNHIVRKVKNFL